MTLYFFHMATRDKKVHDSVGKHLSSLGAAHEHALHLICSTMRYVDAPRAERWMIEVCSPPDNTALVVLFPVSDHWSGRWGEFSQLKKDRQTLLSYERLGAP